jgi:CRP-like cAMP-binding protein
MSLALREQIAIYLFKDYLLKIPFFQLASDSVLGMICMQLRQVIYMPNDFIIREGDIGKELFMIVKGVVRVMPPKDEAPSSPSVPISDSSMETGSVTATATATDTNTQAAATQQKKILLGEGDFFGEIGVVMEVQRTRSVRAESMAELCILSRDGFNKIMVEFPEFATAMKRLIVKRVSEMWKEGGDKEQIEKMTALADLKMKKAAQTYRNMDKLRVKTRALQTIYPRLSKLVKGSSQHEERMVVVDPDTNFGALGVAFEEEESYPSEDLAPLPPIGEFSEEKSPARRLPHNITPPRGDEEWHATPEEAKEGHAAPGLPRSWLTSHHHKDDREAHLHDLQSRLKHVEQSMETRLTELSSRVGQLLGYFETQFPRDGAPTPPSIPEVGR